MRIRQKKLEIAHIPGIVHRIFRKNYLKVIKVFMVRNAINVMLMYEHVTAITTPRCSLFRFVLEASFNEGMKEMS